MGDLAVSASDASARSRNSTDTVLLGCILLCLALQMWLALVMEINWDEFFYLSQIYDYQRGDLQLAPQTVHVHLFGWLTSIPGFEVRQVVIGRLVMLLCEGATSALIYALARLFFSRTPSLLAVLGFASAGFTVIHGASFRADPLAAMLIMIALVSIARAPLQPLTALGAALSAALAALVTAKVVFYTPALIGLAWWRWSNGTSRSRLLKWLTATAIFAGLFLAALYAFHLSALPQASNTNSQAIMGGAARTTLVDAGFLPRRVDILQAAMFSPVQTLLMILGLGSVLACLKSRGDERREGLAVLAGAAPVLCLFLYRNAFPYFFPFILAPAMILVAMALERWEDLQKRTLLLAIAMIAMACATAIQRSQRDQGAQDQLVSQVHRIFSKPTPYIDRNSMISSFPKRGFFMSTWGRLNYRRGGPIFGKVLAREPVPLLILNSPVLEEAVTAGTQSELFSEDRAILRDNYIPHWGAIWVAGQRLRIGPKPTMTQVAVPGAYTLEDASAVIDGRLVEIGQTIDLDRGRHVLSNPTPARVTLRWGDHLYRPNVPPSSAPIYYGF